ADGKAQQPDEQQRSEQRAQDQRVEQHALVAQALAALLQIDRQRRAHASSPIAAAPMILTNASSRLCSPACSRSACGLPSATTRPPPMITMRSHIAATSCMMWVENSTQRP